ncbi:MAG: hypothetical protein F6J93_28060 [Oscillatoria sp. SIO1A7]|nr:hypothetical protein [Oscillatoria sp. SIO1A7]
MTEQWILGKEFRFEAAHKLPCHDGKRARLHGQALDNSMDRAAFDVFVEKCFCPNLWLGAVVVMDNLPAHNKKLRVD